MGKGWAQVRWISELCAGIHGAEKVRKAWKASGNCSWNESDASALVVTWWVATTFAKEQNGRTPRFAQISRSFSFFLGRVACCSALNRNAQVISYPITKYSITKKDKQLHYFSEIFHLRRRSMKQNKNCYYKWLRQVLMNSRYEKWYWARMNQCFDFSLFPPIFFTFSFSRMRLTPLLCSLFLLPVALSQDRRTYYSADAAARSNVWVPVNVTATPCIDEKTQNACNFLYFENIFLKTILFKRTPAPGQLRTKWMSRLRWKIQRRLVPFSDWL